MKKISIIVPVYNEEDNILSTYKILKEITNQIKKKYDHEIIFMDNCSVDSSFNILTELAKKDKKLKVIKFSRNFGYQKSILTGYINCKGDAAIQFDCDLQDPPNLIIEFIKYWERGYKVVYGIRKKRKENILINLIRKFFYRIINMLSDYYIPNDAGDFRLIDKVIINELKSSQDSNPYLRGQIASFGYSQIGFDYERNKREKGKSKFNSISLFLMAIDALTNHSISTIRIISMFSIMLSILSFIGITFYIFLKISGLDLIPAGFTTTTILILTSIFINTLFFGVLLSYTAKIFMQTKNIKNVIIEKTINI